MKSIPCFLRLDLLFKSSNSHWYNNYTIIILTTKVPEALNVLVKRHRQASGGASLLAERT